MSELNLFKINFSQSSVSAILFDLINNAKLRRNQENTHSRIYHFLNAFCITESMKDLELLDCYRDMNSINLCDGVSVAVSHKLILKTSINRIRGGDFVRSIFTNTSNPPLKIGIIGGSKDSQGKIVEVLERDFPAMTLVYMYTPPFTEIANYPISEISKSLKYEKVDVCLIAIGTPKQDFLAKLLSKKVDTDFLCIGAALEFLVGNKKEAPKLLQKMGLEWLFRLLSEPKRLWRRYLIGIPKFVVIVVKFFFLKHAKFNWNK